MAGAALTPMKHNYELKLTHSELKKLSEVLGQHAKLQLSALYQTVLHELHKEQA